MADAEKLKETLHQRQKIRKKVAIRKVGEQFSLPCAIGSIRSAEDGPKRRTTYTRLSYSNLVEDTSGCLLGEEDVGSDFAKETNTVLMELPTLRVWMLIVIDVLEIPAIQATRDLSRQLKTTTPETIQQPLIAPRQTLKEHRMCQLWFFLILKAFEPQWQSGSYGSHARNFKVRRRTNG